ncbi:ABC transporter ATP-binding protein [Collinsella intestinalis]|uniref:ABC transporter ATP-binding protein n=1 Tax=Collinsella intestinalis TaxID=147207 RepID=A0A414NEK9_9ACTN|nr:ABC transporter ATP-binding protein [Collinsella intestinalis]RHF38244.1 ABC transporter ATP-binding protein [Collinsella intestinalis]
MRLLLRTIKPYKALVAATLAALLLDVAGTLYVPTMLAGMINQGVTSGNTDFIIGQGLKMLVACCCASGGALLGNYLCARLASYVGRDIRNAVYDASLTYSGGDFEEFGTGSMITRTLNDVNVIQQTVMLAAQAMLPVPIICVMGTVLSFRVDAQMGAMMLAVVSVVMVFAVIAVRRAAPIFEKMQGFIDRMNVVLRENIIGVRVIRAFGKERHEEGRMGRVFTDYADAAIKVNWIFAGVDCFSFCLMNIAEVLLMWLGGNRVGAHAMEIGNISAVVEYAMLIMFYIMMAQFVALMVPRAIVCLQRCAEVIEKKPSILDGTGSAPLAPGSNGEAATAGEAAVAGEVTVTDEDGAFNASLSDTAPVATFDHVSFRFPDADEDTLHDIDFSCRRGQTTAIIGSTGSGKSTIAKMLLRLHDVTEGSVRFSGVDVRSMTQHDLRERIAYVPQKAWLFSGTIASNLRDGRADATEAEMRHALDVAQSDFVWGLPERLDAPVAQGGTNFSGGQRQRLAIARALMKHADLYIFDDSFSALDFKTDAALRRALKPETRNAAVLIIAQRINTILHADQIVVLKDGRIVGKGTHKELMEGCEVYREIAESQMKGGE